MNQVNSRIHLWKIVENIYEGEEEEGAASSCWRRRMLYLLYEIIQTKFSWQTELAEFYHHIIH